MLLTAEDFHLHGPVGGLLPFSYRQGCDFPKVLQTSVFLTGPSYDLSTFLQGNTKFTMLGYSVFGMNICIATVALN